MNGNKKIVYSKTLQEEEIYKKYGRPTYGSEREDGSIAGFTRGHG